MEIKDATTTSLADDLKELTLDSPITKPLKSTEELEQLTVDEQLNDIERAVYLLSSGQEVQRISVITNLPDLLKDSHAECMRRVVPKVREVLHVAQAEMQLAASSAFLQILQRDLVPIQNYAQTFLQTILTSVDSKDPDVANAWLETLLDVIDLLPKEVVKKDILAIAIDKGQLSQSVQARLSCCKILGKIATKFEPFLIKKEILPVVQSMCQDVDYEVRGCMCRQLNPVARGLGLEATKSAILPELVELTNDEESFVRVAGLETVVNILSLLDEDTCRSTIIPLVCKFCQQSLQAEDTALPVVAKQLGHLAHGLSGILSDEQKQWFVDYFKKLCKVGLSNKSKESGNKIEEKESPTKDTGGLPELPDMLEEEEMQMEVRRNCAFNFPAMVLFIGARAFKGELSQAFSSLCKDPHVQVRRTMSMGFHEIGKALGPHACLLQNDLITLLKDDCTEVLKGVVNSLPATLDAVVGFGGSSSETKLNYVSSEIIPAILAAEIVISSSNDWRLQEDIIRHMACLQAYTSSETVYQKIIPVLFRKLRTARALPVRHAAARSTLFFIRNLKKLEQRQELIHMLVEDFCHGRSCHHRSLFIDISRMMLDLYSKAFFKEYFFEYLIGLHLDTVPNIRLRLCSILPDLKRIIKLPTDRNLLQQLDQCVRKLLIGEKDKDVSNAIKSAVEELDKIPIQMESLTRRMFMEDDAEDKRKEDEEKQLIEAEEKELKKEEEAKSAKAEKSGRSNSISGKKDNGTSKIPGPKKDKKGSIKDKERGSAGLKRTPSTTTQATGTTSSSKVEYAVQSQFLYPAYVTEDNQSPRGSKMPTPTSKLVKSKSTNHIPQLIPRGSPPPSRIPHMYQNGMNGSLPHSDSELPSKTLENGDVPSETRIPTRSKSLYSRAKSDLVKRKSTSILDGRSSPYLSSGISLYSSQPDLLKPGFGLRKDSPSNKTTAKTTRSGTSGVPAPSSAGAGSRKGTKSSTDVNVARRGSLSSASSTGSDVKAATRKNSNGSIPSTGKSKKSK